MPAGIYKRIKPVSDVTKEKHRIAGLKRKQTESTKIKIGNASRGRKHSEEARNKNRIWHTGKSRSEETKKKIREWQVAHPNRIFKETSVEIKIELELQNRQILYNKQVPLCNITTVDFYLPDYNIVIQCDGCYYHSCQLHYPKEHTDALVRDKNQDLVLESNGFKIYRFWEHEINKSSEECINKINLNLDAKRIT